MLDNNKNIRYYVVKKRFITSLLNMTIWDILRRGDVYTCFTSIGHMQLGPLASWRGQVALGLQPGLGT